MCNLNILITKKEGRIKDIVGFLMATTSNSFTNNPDGEGFWAGGVLVKGYEKINYVKYAEQIIDSNIVITHQRLSTSGHDEKYCHPFEDDDFVLVHNGIINDFLGKNGSDTYGFFKQFTKQFKKDKGKNREERIKKIIKDLLENLSFGSYSIALFDKKTEKLYYFKNFSTEIHFYENENFIYISTIEENKLFLNLIGEGFKELDIKDNIIYRTSIKEDIVIRNIGEIKDYLGDYGGGYDYDWGYKRKKTNLPTIEEVNKKIKDQTLVICSDLAPCKNCQILTYNLNVKGERICNDCLEEDEKYYDALEEDYV